jgi:hypothetical protein
VKTRPSVRIQCRSRADAKELALRLEADGYRAAFHWKTVIARTQTGAEAEQLAAKLGVDVLSGGGAVWEARARAGKRLAILAGLGSTSSRF